MAHSRLNRITSGDIIIGAIMVLLCFIAVYPVWYTIIISFNDANDYQYRRCLLGSGKMWKARDLDYICFGVGYCDANGHYIEKG